MFDALLFTQKAKKSDRQMNAENGFFLSSSIVIIFVVRHATNNKQLETDECLCVFYFLENISSMKKKKNNTIDEPKCAIEIFEIF
jgi:hypothetical protein